SSRQGQGQRLGEPSPSHDRPVRRSPRGPRCLQALPNPSPMPQVTLCTVGKFHMFDLARQLESRSMLCGIYTGYPRFKLRSEGLPETKIRSYPWLQTLYMARARLGLAGERISKEIAHASHVSLSKYAARTMPSCDVFMAMSGCGLEAGLEAKRRGTLYICDRGSAHILAQESILREEFERMGVSRTPIDPRKIERELKEYEAADLITAPSEFAIESFVQHGVPRSKLRKLEYG